MSGSIWPASRYDKGPVRMFTVEVAVFINHLGLDPDTEFEAHVIDLPNQLTKCTAQFFLIDLPVSQSAQFAVTLSEPAVIQYKHLNSQFCCL